MNSKRTIYIILIYNKKIFFTNIITFLKKKSSVIITIILKNLKKKLNKLFNFKNNNTVSTQKNRLINKFLNINFILLKSTTLIFNF